MGINLKLYLKNKLRKLVKAKKNQGFMEALRARNNFYLAKYIYKKKFTLKELIDILVTMGITKGDNIMVHSSYDEFYNYNGEINDFIEALINLVGKEGTVLMPCYGMDDKFFDVNYTPSYAGLITEYFRRKEGAIRSINTNFSICAYGKLAEVLTKDHINSENGFDENSPYYKFAQLDNSKVICLGLGKKSTYLSVMHCIDYLLKDEVPYFRYLLSEKSVCTLVDYEGVSHERTVINRVNNAKLDKTFLRNMYSYMAKNTWCYRRLSNLDIVIYNAKEVLNIGLKHARQGKVYYKNPVPKKELFIPLRSKNG